MLGSTTRNRMSPIEVSVMMFLNDKFGGDHRIGDEVHLGCDDWEKPARHPSGFLHRHIYSKRECRCD